MKQARKYLITSWVMTLIILIMWLLADVGIFKEQSITWDDDTVSFIGADDCLYYLNETYYGLGKNLYYNRESDVLTDSVEFKNNDIWENIGTVHTWESFYDHRGKCAWWVKKLPGFKLGWLLLSFFVIIYIFLIRKSGKTTKPVAKPIKQSRTSILHKIYPEKSPKFEKTRILVNPAIIYILLGITLFISLIIVFADLYLVYVIEIMKYYEFTPNTHIDTSFRNFEYILPTIVYLGASIISAFCIIKYIKHVKEFAFNANDVAGN